MINRPIQFVAASFGLTLETLAFISPMPAEEPIEAPDEAVLVRLPLTGGDLRRDPACRGPAVWQSWSPQISSELRLKIPRWRSAALTG